MVADEIGVGRGHERRKPAQEVTGLQEQAICTLGVGPGLAQVVDDASIGSAAQSFLRERRRQAVAAELFQGVAVVGRHDTRCVQREASDLGAGSCLGGRVIEQLESELGERWLEGRGQLEWLLRCARARHRYRRRRHRRAR